jgi:hypothetical protein
MQNIAHIGHNNPPSDEEILIAKLNENYAREIEDINRLSERELPDSVSDDVSSGKVADFLAAARSAEKAIEAIHKKEKDSFLKLGKVVDGFKNKHVAWIDSLIAPAKAKQLAYLEMKAEAERERIRKAAEIERQRAERLAEEARIHEQEGIADTAEELMESAIFRDNTAARMEDFANNAKDSKLARTVSQMGSISGMRTVWAGDIENIGAIDLEALRQYIKEDHIQMAINAFVKEGGRKLSGVKIYQKSTLR